ncbi:ABC transporter permease [Sporosarcina sp. P33]|uniref:ABC transporter permease n=1 Tax=Sporosarcina sp. P33 TaxID=1930764 RepID=UPI0009BF79D5|nr:ABC transporter permease [Sporosarcina sp. P33]ARD48271.1 peptide ABC transporter [Sporosarcina sp. P33]
MRSYFINRLLSLIPVLFIVSVVIFMIIHLTPGDPAAMLLGEEATEQQIQDLREELGLDLPIIAQYGHWILNALQGDLGTSYFMKQPVIDAILSHLAPTVSVAIIAAFISLIISIPIGILAATRRGTNTDRTVMGISLLGMSVPSFLLGLFLILLFGVKLQWLPVAGYQPLSAGFVEHIKYLILPSIALGSMHAALIARMTRSSLLEVLNMNYIKTARSKGVSEYLVVMRHTLRNSFLPILTVIGQTLGALIAGAVVTETIFNIPGIGQLIINSVERRDYAVIQGVVLFVTCTYVFINLIIDLLYGVVDPRVRLNKK